ncbi:MAG: hypothetical protein ACM3H8_02715 [Sphingobacteriales bacterium]
MLVLRITKSIKLSFLVCVSVILLNSCYYDKEELLYGAACDSTNVTYSATIKPIIATNCLECHGGLTPSAGFSLETYQGVKAKVDQGRLIGAVSHFPGFSPMPKNNPQLGSCNIAAFRTWVRNGAPYN